MATLCSGAMKYNQSTQYGSWTVGYETPYRSGGTVGIKINVSTNLSTTMADSKYSGFYAVCTLTYGSATSGAVTITCPGDHTSGGSSGSGYVTMNYSGAEGTGTISCYVTKYPDFEGQMTGTGVYPNSTSANVTIPGRSQKTISYNMNQGTGGPSNSTIWSDESYSIPSSTPTRDGYTFNYWSGSDGNKYKYNGGTGYYATYTGTGNVTLTAQWTPVTFNVTLDPNGGTVTTTTISVTVGGTYSDLTDTKYTPTWQRHQWDGWYTEKVDGDPRHSYDTVKFDDPRTLYAHWTALNIPVYIKQNNTIHQIEKAYVKVNNQVKECTIYTKVGGQIKPIT